MAVRSTGRATRAGPSCITVVRLGSLQASAGLDGRGRSGRTPGSATQWVRRETSTATATRTSSSGHTWYDNGESDEGRAFVYHGSSTGLTTGSAGLDGRGRPDQRLVRLLGRHHGRRKRRRLLRHHRRGIPVQQRRERREPGLRVPRLGPFSSLPRTPCHYRRHRWRRRNSQPGWQRRHSRRRRQRHHLRGGGQRLGERRSRQGQDIRRARGRRAMGKPRP